MKFLFKKTILLFTITTFLIVTVTAFTITGSAGTVFALEYEAEEGFVDAAYSGEEAEGGSDAENGDTGEGEYPDGETGDNGDWNDGSGENEDIGGDTGEAEGEDPGDDTGYNEDPGENGETGSDEGGSGDTDGNDGSGENGYNEDPGENGETGSGETGSGEDGTGDNGDGSLENRDNEDESGENESGENGEKENGSEENGEKEDGSEGDEKQEDPNSGDNENGEDNSGDNQDPDNKTEDNKDGKDADSEDEKDGELEDSDKEKFEGDDWEKDEDFEKDKDKQTVQQFAGESGTTDFATLPLLELGAEELTICSFCEGKSLGSVQKAVLLSYLMSYRELNEELSDTVLIDSVGIGKEAYRKWCEKQDLEASDIRTQLTYIYSALFRNAEQKNTKDHFVSAFRNAKNAATAAASLYAAASARSIRLPYTKEQIMQNVVPKAKHYVELFALGGEKRDGTANVTYYCQGNYANVPYDTGNVADSGCGITAFSMVASEFTGLNLGPEVTATWAYENGVNTVTSWGAYWFLAQRFGLKFLGQYSGGFDTAVEALKEGNLVIASLRQDGFFTVSGIGHYILLTGVEKDGRICVNDPASYDRSLAGPFDYSRVFGGCIQYWIFGR